MNLANARINSLAVELLDPCPEHRVLEVGFGGGVGLEKLIPRVAFVAGIDPSAACVRIVRQRLRDELHSGRVRIEQTGVEAMPFETESFDRALTVNTIYFWERPERGLREILRVLRPAGRLLLATEIRRVPSRIAKHGFSYYPEEELAELLRRAGYSDVHFEHRSRFLFALAAKD
jgi:SAM-dependent methyltransferase